MSDVIDNPEANRFELRQDGHLAELVYEVRPGRMVLAHTGVPDEIGGQGLGGRLVRAAVERAAREERMVIPRCPYAREWLERHPDVAATADIAW